MQLVNVYKKHCKHDQIQHKNLRNKQHSVKQNLYIIASGNIDIVFKANKWRHACHRWFFVALSYLNRSSVAESLKICTKSVKHQKVVFYCFANCVISRGSRGREKVRMRQFVNSIIDRIRRYKFIRMQCIHNYCN